MSESLEIGHTCTWNRWSIQVNRSPFWTHALYEKTIVIYTGLALHTLGYVILHAWVSTSGTCSGIVTRVCNRCDGVTLDLSVSSNMIASVSENENKVSCILPPPHHLCTHNCLQQSIKECFRIVIVCRDSQTTNSLLQTWKKQVCFESCILINVICNIHVAVPDRNRILFRCVFRAHHPVWHAIALSFH